MKNTPERIVLEAFADELEKTALNLNPVKMLGRGAKSAKMWFGPLSLGITALLAPFTMKRFANTSIKGPEKLRPPSFSPGRPRGGFHG